MIVSFSCDPKIGIKLKSTLSESVNCARSTHILCNICRQSQSNYETAKSENQEVIVRRNLLFCGFDFNS